MSTEAALTEYISKELASNAGEITRDTDLTDVIDCRVPAFNLIQS